MGNLVIVLITAVTACYSLDVRCTDKRAELCCRDEDMATLKTTRVDTAPVPKDVFLSYEGPTGLTITWTQKVSHLPYVEGYRLSAIAHSLPEEMPYKLRINSSAIMRDLSSSDAEVAFSYAGMLLVPNDVMTVTVYALPMYNADEEDQYIEAQIGPGVPIRQRPQPTPPPRILTPTASGPKPTTSHVVTTRMQTARIQTSRAPLPSVLINDNTSYWSMKIVVAVVATNTITIMSIVACLMVRRRNKRKLRGHSRTYIKCQDAAERGTSESKSPAGSGRRILVLANSDRTTDTETDSGYAEKVALCLANTLQSWEAFNVSCNLWMSREISAKGIAAWAHEVMKANDKVILVCSSNMPVSKPEISFNGLSPYTLLITNLLKSSYFDHEKFVIACFEETSAHKCFAGMYETTLNTCRRFHIQHSVEELLGALPKSGISQEKAKALNNTFSQQIRKIRSENESPTSSRISEHGSHDLVYQNLLAPDECEQEAKKKRRRDPSSGSSGSDGKPESQYDSVFSSRCNSQSTE